MRRATKCEGCGGTGIRAPASPSCRIEIPARHWIVVEKCNTCDLFPDDLSAALSRYRIAGWFTCATGGEHALADKRTRLRRPKDVRDRCPERARTC